MDRRVAFIVFAIIGLLLGVAVIVLLALLGQGGEIVQYVSIITAIGAYFLGRWGANRFGR